MHNMRDYVADARFMHAQPPHKKERFTSKATAAAAVAGSFLAS
jgi:hypothetical protein